MTASRHEPRSNPFGELVVRSADQPMVRPNPEVYAPYSVQAFDYAKGADRHIMLNVRMQPDAPLAMFTFSIDGAEELVHALRGALAAARFNARRTNPSDPR